MTIGIRMVRGRRARSFPETESFRESGESSTKSLLQPREISRLTSFLQNPFRFLPSAPIVRR